MEEEYRSLMARYQAGEARAFETLYVRLAPELRRLVLRSGPHASPADDVVQQIFIELHRARSSYSPHDPFEPWLAAVVGHVIDARKRPRRRKGKVGGFFGRLVSARHAG